jgi:hypothetical protein
MVFFAVLILFFGDEPSFSPSPLPTTPNKSGERLSTAEKMNLRQVKYERFEPCPHYSQTGFGLPPIRGFFRLGGGSYFISPIRKAFFLAIIRNSAPKVSPIGKNSFSCESAYVLNILVLIFYPLSAGCNGVNGMLCLGRDC